MDTEVLDESAMQRGLDWLARQDSVFGAIHAEHGLPPFWLRRPGWRSLLQIILEQQVSLASGQAVYSRMVAAIQPFTAARLLQLPGERLRSLGLTRQKTRYAQGLALAVVEKRFSAAGLSRMNDEQARVALCELNGVGPWTADVYLLMALRRRDVWPDGDIALQQAILERYGVPRDGDRSRLSASWRPWRSVAARMLWHDYLSKRGRN